MLLQVYGTSVVYLRNICLQTQRKHQSPTLYCCYRTRVYLSAYVAALCVPWQLHVFSSSAPFLLPPIGELVIAAHARSGQVTRMQTGHSFVPVATLVMLCSSAAVAC